MSTHVCPRNTRLNSSLNQANTAVQSSMQSKTVMKYSADIHLAYPVTKGSECDPSTCTPLPFQTWLPPSSAVTWLLDRVFSTDPASRTKRWIGRLILLAGSVLNALSSNQVTALLRAEFSGLVGVCMLKGPMRKCLAPFASNPEDQLK